MSDKNNAARIRNWKIFELRGLAYNRSKITTPVRRALFDALVDAELEALGAKTETQARAERDAKLDAIIAAEPPPHADDDLDPDFKEV